MQYFRPNNGDDDDNNMEESIHPASEPDEQNEKEGRNPQENFEVNFMLHIRIH
jgi:hypothetical protein